MATSTRDSFHILNNDLLSPKSFDRTLFDLGNPELLRHETRTLQINVGKVCNQACHHCHVDAGPKRTESMTRETADRILQLLRSSPSVDTVDITGGAPEINPHFTMLASAARNMGRHVIDRCNLTIFFEAGHELLPSFLASNQIEVIASLPCYTAKNVDSQRGRGVFDKSIAALRLLNSLGYGLPESNLRLSLVYNPLGPSLPPPQETLEADYKQHLRDESGIEFHRLLTITNMPVSRFANTLHQSGKFSDYMGLLVNHFNPYTVDNLMCRSLVSVGWDGKLYDCDFNQMLSIGLGSDETPSIWDINTFSGWAGRKIATGNHCYGCTAGSGSSCGGKLQ